MAFAAARMIKDKNKGAGPPPHPFVPRSASGRALGKSPLARGHVKHIKHKGKKNKGKGTHLTYDLIVNIDLDEWQLTDEQVAEFKEVFMLFDKDEDGVITFPELNVVMKSLGQRPSEKELLKMVREVSEDQIYDTIEFNEFLQMMSKQQRQVLTGDSLKDAFRIFDKDNDGLISVDELRSIMTNLGDKMTDKELDEMVAAADCNHDGHVNYEEFIMVLSLDGKKKKKRNKKNKKPTLALPIAATSTTKTTKALVVRSSNKDTTTVTSNSTTSNISSFNQAQEVLPNNNHSSSNILGRIQPSADNKNNNNNVNNNGREINIAVKPDLRHGKVKAVK